MHQKDREDKNAAETFSRIVEAIEKPDNPKRLEAMAANEARAGKWRRFERYGAVLSNMVFIALGIFLLGNIRIENSTGNSYWLSIIIGAVAGIFLLLIANTRRAVDPKFASPVAMLLVAVTILTDIFLGDKIRQRLAPSTQVFVSVTLVSFLVTLSAYNLIVNLLSLWKGDSSKGGIW